MSTPDVLARNSKQPILPIWLRIGALAFVLGAILLASFVRIDSEASLERGEPVASRQINFHDEANGWISVRDAEDDQEILRLEPSRDNFMRGVMRSMARERRAKGFTSEPAFEVTAWGSGHLSVTDMATGRRVEISAFGADNVDSFARLILNLEQRS